MLGVLWLRAWAAHPARMMWASAAIHVGSLAVGAVILFAAGAAPGGALLLVGALLVAVMW